MAELRMRWRRRRLNKRWIAATVLTAALAGAGGWMAVNRAPSVPNAKLTAARLKLATEHAPPAPQALQDELDALVRGYGEEVGVAVTDVKTGWTAGVDAERAYPQQSVSKLWVAIALLRAVDEGRMNVDGPVTLTDADRSVFFQPVAYNIGKNGYQTEISALLRRAIVESDNAANDKLMRELGGPVAVAQALDEMGLKDVRVGAYERDLQAKTAGVAWRPEYGVGWNFQAAREALPRAQRQAALDAYLADPLDGASPAGITRTLAALQRGELLSPESTERLLDLMHKVRTGPRRLKGGLPAGWSLGHKTGTGQDFMGASVGINDVGLLTAPDGRSYAVAVMIRRTRQGVPARLELMQAVTRAVAAEWARDRTAPLTPNVAIEADAF
jgi:beta-lactamase class A